ncbi:MAG: metallophosphoesterase, partial [Anaerolineae bacterium]|nr:metallophosphoesterase [Anaerolineae bacterium]
RLAVEDMPRGGPVLTLVHAPDQVREAEALGLRAVLAGHTHGGQVQVPFLGAIYKQNTLGGGYVSGLLKWGETTLYTSRGLGVRSGLPARFLAPPEVTLVRLVRVGNPE